MNKDGLKYHRQIVWLQTSVRGGVSSSCTHSHLLFEVASIYPFLADYKQHIQSKATRMKNKLISNEAFGEELRLSARHIKNSSLP